MTRALLAGAGALLLLIAGGCVPPAEETTTPEHFDPETVMGQIQARGELRIGIANDRRPLGFVPAHRGLIERPGGLTADLGDYVAEALHVDPAYVLAPNDELLGMVDSGEVDVAFPITTITEPLVRHYGFTDPYWIAHQRVLGFGQFDPADLAGEEVCSFIDPETEVLLSDLVATVEILTVDEPRACLPSLAAGSPATASDAILLGLLQDLEERVPADRLPEIGGDDLTTEGYGAVVDIESSGLAEVVDNILTRAKEDGPWERAVEKWLDPDEPVAPPELTVEEAAALYPASY